MLLSRGAIYKKLLIHLEYQPRLLTTTSQTQAIMHRNAFGWQVADKHSLWIGHAYLATEIPSKFTEYRTFLQWLHMSKLLYFKTSQHIRMEQRKFSRYAHLSHRLRYKFRILQPLYKKYNLYFVFQNEIFYNVNTISENNRGGFEQNRLYIGVNKDLGKGHAIELAITRTLRFIKNETNDLMNFYVTRYSYYF